MITHEEKCHEKARELAERELGRPLTDVEAEKIAKAVGDYLDVQRARCTRVENHQLH